MDKSNQDTGNQGTSNRELTGKRDLMQEYLNTTVMLQNGLRAEVVAHIPGKKYPYIGYEGDRILAWNELGGNSISDRYNIVQKAGMSTETAMTVLAGLYELTSKPTDKEQYMLNIVDGELVVYAATGIESKINNISPVFDDYREAYTVINMLGKQEIKNTLLTLNLMPTTGNSQVTGKIQGE